MPCKLTTSGSLGLPVLQSGTRLSNDEAIRATEQGEPNVEQPETRKPWIRYRTELRHRITGELLYSKDSRVRKGEEDDFSGGTLVLELITRYDTNSSDFKSDKSSGQQQTSWMGQTSASAPTYSVKIYSQSIIDALQSVVEYYPSQDLSGTSIEVKWPYAVLVHHYDQLLEFKAKCQGKSPAEMCVREKDAPEHIDLLIQFLDENIMERVRAEQQRLKGGFGTFENLWVAYKPGRTVGDLTKQDIWQFYVVADVTGGIYDTPPTSWIMKGWTLAYDGKYIGRRHYQITIGRFNGEMNLTTNTCFVDDLENVSEGPVRQAATQGEMWYGLLQKQCKQHEGKSLEFPYNQVC